MSFFDNFTFPQVAIPAAPHSSVNFGPLATSLGPVPVRRELRSFGGHQVDINVSAASSLRIGTGVSAAASPSFEYNFAVDAAGADDPTASINLGSTISIALADPSASAASSLTLEMADADGNSDEIVGSQNGTSVEWFPDAFSPPVDFTRIQLLRFRAISISAETSFTFTGISSLVTCVAKDTQILMSDGTCKPIQDIQRGDLVASDRSMTKFHTVARLTTQSIDESYPADLTVFQPSSLEQNVPNKELIITSNHALIYKDKRRPAKCFSSYPLIKQYYHNTLMGQMGQLLPPNSDGTYTVYDLQFETLGSYVANGVTIQSRSPRSNLTPLPKDLYFDQSLYSDQTGEDDVEYEYPLDFSPVNL